MTKIRLTGFDGRKMFQDHGVVQDEFDETEQEMKKENKIRRKLCLECVTMVRTIEDCFQWSMFEPTIKRETKEKCVRQVRNRSRRGVLIFMLIYDSKCWKNIPEVNNT